MGARGDTAGLLPGSSAVSEEERFVRFNACPEGVNLDRITMTLPIMNAARFIAVYVTGATTSRAIRQLSAGRETRETLPISGIVPINGELKWYLDGPACRSSDNDDD